MKLIQNKVAEFFESHPKTNEVYEALGVLFTEKERADKYLAGVAGRMVTTHTRDGVVFERESDGLRHKIMEQENKVAAKHLEYEAAPPMAKQQAMSEWQKELKKVDELKARLEKQLTLESKDEKIAKEQKPAPEGLKVPVLTAEQLTAKISAQQAIVDGNEALIPKLTGTKLKSAKNVQKQEVSLLEALKKQLDELPPAVEVDEMIDHVVTQEDLDNNPELFQEGVKVGDTVQLPVANKKEDDSTEGGDTE